MAKRYFLLSLLATLYLASDSGRDIHQLLFNASHSAQPSSLLWEAARQGDPVARTQLVDYAVATGESYWLQKAVSEGSPEAAWALYQSESGNLKNYYLKLAAQGDVAEAQYTLAMASDTRSEREAWLVRAANNNFLDAKIALVNWYLLNQQVELADPWLSGVADSDNALALVYGKQLWAQGQHNEAKQWIEKSAERGHKPAQALVSVINQYRPIGMKAVKATEWPNHCAQRVSIVATSLTAIERADEYYQSFNSDSRLNALPICMRKPVWLKPNLLTCSEQWQGQHRLGCDLTALSGFVRKSNSTHVAIVADQGKANVFNGAMFLDVGDTYSVFVHELAHWAGFVDEYPLSEGLARLHCRQTTAPNLVFDGKLTYAPLTTINEWQEADGAMVIAPSRTCRNVGKHAYKPSSRMTFMEFHDSQHIPQLYLSMWKARLQRKDLQYPIYINLHESFRTLGNEEEANYWQNRYQTYLVTGQ